MCRQDEILHRINNLDRDVKVKHEQYTWFYRILMVLQDAINPFFCRLNEQAPHRMSGPQLQEEVSSLLKSK